MRIRHLFAAVAVAIGLVGTLLAQQQPLDPTRTPGIQAPADPNRAAFVMSHCKSSDASGQGQQAGRAGGGAGGGRRGGGPAAPEEAKEYAVTAIPGVINAGQRWKSIWTDSGNNADSPIGLPDGFLVAQNDKSQILKVGLNGQVTLVATDT